MNLFWIRYSYSSFWLKNVNVSIVFKQVLACIAVNDPFVMEGWGRDQKVDGKVRMLADTKG